MKTAVLLFSLVAAAALQAVTPAWDLFGQAKIPFLPGVIMYYALTRNAGEGIRAAFLGGLIQDSLGLVPLGFSSLAFCLATLAWGYYRNIVFVREGLTHILFGSLGCGGITLGIGALLLVSGEFGMSPAGVVGRALGSALLGGVSAPVLFRLMASSERTLGVLEPVEAP